MQYGFPSPATAKAFSSPWHHCALICLLICLTVMPAKVCASTSANTLALHNEWLKLGHYYPALQPGHYKSAVDDAAFFIATNGKHSPTDELLATVEKLQAGDASTFCRFPARSRWLAQHLTLPPAPTCVDYDRWKDEVNGRHTVLVFAAAYLNSPSSMFGHTFLRFDPADRVEKSPLFSHAINFGATTATNDNSFFYAYKGLFGGYPGFFAVMPYYEKLKEYGRIENRDLWEYELNLSAAETDRLLDHVWEMKDISFDYFFFDENCSYRLLELLEWARPSATLTANFKWRAIPIDTVRAVNNAGLVAEVHYRTSAATHLLASASTLTDEQQLLSAALADSADAQTSAIWQKADDADRAAITRTAYEALRFRQTGKERNAAVAARSLALLKQINQLPTLTEPPIKRPPAPHAGHETRLLAISAGNTDGSDSQRLELRPSYHDLLDNQSGYLPGAAINMGVIGIESTKAHDVRLNTLRLIEILSHSPRTPFYSPITWRVNAGLERLYHPQDDTLSPYLEGGAGATWRWGPAMTYLMGTARNEYDSITDENMQLAVGTTQGILYFSPVGTGQIELTTQHYFSGGERNQLFWQQQFELGKNHALRLEVSHLDEHAVHRDTIQLGFRVYF